MLLVPQQACSGKAAGGGSSLTCPELQVCEGKAGVGVVQGAPPGCAQLAFYGKERPELRKQGKGAVPRGAEVSVKSCFLPHLLLELKVVIFQI